MDPGDSTGSIVSMAKAARMGRHATPRDCLVAWSCMVIHCFFVNKSKGQINMKYTKRLDKVEAPLRQCMLAKVVLNISFRKQKRDQENRFICL